MRRSEVSALRWADGADGDGVLVTIRRGKTNQEGERRRPAPSGRSGAAVPGCVVWDVRARPLPRSPSWSAYVWAARQGCAQSSVGAVAPAAKCRYASSACARTPALMPCTTWGVR